MADPEDLLSKADALMARQRPGRVIAASYPEIPVLDEVVDIPAADNLPVLTDMLEPDRVAAELSESGRIESALPHEEQYAELTRCMRESMLTALQPEIDRLIEERLKESLEPMVEKLFNELRDDLQLIAHDTLSAAIHTAVERKLGEQDKRIDRDST